MKHIFAICAYKESPYLQECIDSLKAQTDPSEILLCTATPSAFLEEIAAGNGLTYCPHEAKPDIASDWNWAIECCEQRNADYMTLCHQDDLYRPGYAAALKQAIRRDPDFLIWFSDYAEQRGDSAVESNRLLKIKRILLWRMRIPAWQSVRFMKHRTLAMGSPICCPAVSYNLHRIPKPLFLTGMTTDLDWQAWETLAKMPGRFYFDKRHLMLHRIHPGSTTSKVLGEGKRLEQDRAMFRKFWPKPIADLIVRFYAYSEKSNEL